MKKIGALSDTHGYLDEGLLKFLEGCDEIWHAGDIGNQAILQKLEEQASVRAVYGNIDGRDIRLQCPEIQSFECESMRILITHIGGKPGRYDQGIREQIRRIRPDVFMCGHSHILRVEYDRHPGMLYINPGAAGKTGFHKVRTAVRFELDEKDIRNMEVYEVDRNRH
ncbi:MAG TPA: metallophosphoesterase family protein [Bacteroidales bacterium]|nr:metallophosphoesterase family protein [Bacteroidales bacterium]